MTEAELQKEVDITDKATKKMPVKVLNTREKKLMGELDKVKKESELASRKDMRRKIEINGTRAQKIEARNARMARAQSKKEKMAALPLKRSVKKIYGIGEYSTRMSKQPTKALKDTIEEKTELKTLLNLKSIPKELKKRFNELKAKYKGLLWTLN